VTSTSEFRRDSAWRIVLAAAVGCAFGLTALPYYTLGMVAKPIGAEFDWPRAVVQGGILFASIGVLCSAGIAGWLMDRYGARRVALASQAGLALGFVGLACQTGSTTLWYANWFLLAVFGIGTTPLTWSRGIASWFDRERGLALGVGLTGTGVTAFLAPPLMTAIVASAGWRAGYLAIAAGIALVAMPSVWLLFRERGDAGAGAGAGTADAKGAAVATAATGHTLGEALRDYRFWILIGSFLLICAAVTGVNANLVPMLTDGGIGVAEAAGYASLLGLFVIVGRLTAGWLLDRLWAPLVGLLVLLPSALSCLLLQQQLAPAVAVAFLGLAGGAEFDLIAFLCLRYFGTRHYGQIYAWQWASFTVGSGAGPIAFGAIFDASGSYSAALLSAGVAMLAGPALLLALGPYPAGRAAAPAVAATQP
jgi:MFS family permease